MEQSALSLAIDEVVPVSGAHEEVVVRGHVAGTSADRPGLQLWARYGNRTEVCHVDPTRRTDGSRAFQVRLPNAWPSKGLPTIEVVAHVDHQVAAVRRPTTPSEHPRAGVYASLDLPAPHGDVTDDVVTIAGWCLFEGSATARIEALVNGERVGPVRSYLDRPDLVADWGHRDAPVAGFRERLTLRNASTHGDVTVGVEATAMDGRTWRSPVVTVRRAPRGGDPLHEEYAAVLRDRVAARVAGHRIRQRQAGEPARVAIVTHDLGYGGGQLWLSELIRQMQSTGVCRPEVFSVADGPLRSDLEAAGVPVSVVEAPVVHSLARHEDRVAAWVHTFLCADTDLVLVNTVIPFQAIEAAHRIGLPALWAIHESFDVDVYCATVWGSSIDLAVRDRFRAAFALPQALVFEAAETADLFAEWSRPDQRRLLDYGVDIDEVDRYVAQFDRGAARSELGFRDSDTVVAVVGVFEGRKAEAAMVAAFEELAGIHPDLRLLLVGEHPSPYSAAVREQARRARYGDRITVLPVTPDIARTYAVSDLLVCASDVESLPRSILEAMAFRLPVLSTAVFGVRSLLREGHTGWLTPVGDFGHLAATLHQVLLQDRSVWHAIAETARAEVERRAGERSYGLLLAEVIRNLADGAADPLAPLPVCRTTHHEGPS